MGARSHDDDTGATREGMPSLGVPSLAGGRDAREWMPDDLQTVGPVPMSTTDWPGRLAAPLFLQECPWACPYRHNSTIIDPRIPGVVAWGAFEDLPARRRNLPDDVVFSDGEATRQIAPRAAIARVRELGSGVGLYTAGPYPWRLKELPGAGLVDWVGIDVKAARGNYEAVAGHSGVGERARGSLSTVLAHPEVDHEVRLTVYPDGSGDGFEVATWAREMGAGILVLQQARDMGTPDGFSATRFGWDDQVRSFARDIETLDFERFTFHGDSWSICQVTAPHAGNKYGESLTCDHGSRYCVTTS